MLKNPTYTGIGPVFWGSLDRLAGGDEWIHWGTPNCGKGQPDAGRAHRTLGGACEIQERASGGARMSRAVDLAEQVLDLVGDRAEAEVAASDGNLALTRFANSFIHQNVAEVGEAISLRVAVDGRVASARTTTTGRQSLETFVEAALETAALQPVDADWPGLAPPCTDSACGTRR